MKELDNLTKDMESLKAFRDILDIIDEQIVCLFEQRLNIVLDIAALKSQAKLSVKDENREKVILKQCTDIIKNTDFKPLVVELYTKILEISKNIQNKLLENINE